MLLHPGPRQAKALSRLHLDLRTADMSSLLVSTQLRPVTAMETSSLSLLYDGAAHYSLLADCVRLAIDHSLFDLPPLKPRLIGFKAIKISVDDPKPCY